jgi:hypothetical protein
MPATQRLEKPHILFDIMTDARTPSELRNSLMSKERTVGPEAMKLMFRPQFYWAPNIRLQVVGISGHEVANSTLPFPHNLLHIAWERGFDYAPPVVGPLVRESYVQSELNAFRVIPMHPPIRPSHVGDGFLFSLYEDEGRQMLGVQRAKEFGVQPDDLFLFTLMGRA